jgi:hypothetical protein
MGLHNLHWLNYKNSQSRKVKPVKEIDNFMDEYDHSNKDDNSQSFQQTFAEFLEEDEN